MTTPAFYTAVRERLTANWTATPIAWENEPFQVPEDRVTGPGPWLQVEMTGHLLDERSIGAGDRNANLWREEGTLWLHVFVPTGLGSLTARTLIHQAVDLFRGTELGSATFRSASIGLGERAEVNGTWWRISASIDFQRDI